VAVGSMTSPSCCLDHETPKSPRNPEVERAGRKSASCQLLPLLQRRWWLRELDMQEPVPRLRGSSRRSSSQELFVKQWWCSDSKGPREP
jgi:hypothetical protein